MIDSARFRSVIGAFPTGVMALAAEVDGVPVGMAANSFTSVSLDPPLVLVCVAHSSSTWPVLAQAPVLGISVLAAAQARIGRQLSARGVDRFDGVEWTARPSGAILLDGACAWLECEPHTVHRAGDHDIVVLRVVDLDADPDGQPLIFHLSRFLDPAER